MQYLTPLGRLSTITRVHVYGRRLAAIDIQEQGAGIAALARQYRDDGHQADAVIAQRSAARRYAEVRELLGVQE